MNEMAIVELSREALWVIVLTAGPLLLVGTIVGIGVALFQALTTIQEASLTFVPKMVAMLVALLVCLPFMLTVLTEFTLRLFDRIAQGG